METNYKTMPVPDGYEFDRIDDSGNIVLKEKKKELPKTWLKCLRTVNETEYINEDSEIKTDNVAELEAQAYAFDDLDHNHLPLGLGKPMLALCQLLVCRNAWWKQLGWKPDWNSENEKYCIECQCGKIACNKYATTNKILTFPTPKSRNQFLDTFRDLIEEAKELI